MRFTVFPAAMLLTSSAFAADLARYESVPEPKVLVPAYVWTGGYIGLNAGYGGGRADHTSIYDPNWSDDPAPELPSISQEMPNISQPSITPFIAAPTPSVTTLDVTGSGFVGGAQAGYNWQTGSVVYGVETDIQASGIKAEITYDTGWDQGTAGSKISWFGTTRARVGFLPTERVLAYATAGVAYGKLESYAPGTSISRTKTGWTAGAGMEFAVDQHWSLKTEYLYTDLGKLKLESGPNTFESEFRFHTVRAGVNYRF